MKNTYETSGTSPLLNDALYETPLYRNLPNPHGNPQLRDCDEAGKTDPVVAIYITPEGDFNISEQYLYGTPEQKLLSHMIGGLIVENLPIDPASESPDKTNNVIYIQRGVAA